VNTTVVNIKKNKNYDVYIGRGSPWGNPFKIGIYTREEVISKYKEYFYEKIKDLNFRKSVLYLKGKVLGCYCHPLPCHGDIIANYLNNL
jgi:hypothetical protein